jgi:multidrug efflux pump subunit AcrA (membrane-fusion protein)
MDDEIRGFGSLSFHKKVDLAAPSDAVLETLYYREGDSVDAGEIAAVLVNPQISLAVRRAEDAYSQAVAAGDLAQAQLAEGEFRAEARILENEKAGIELAQARLSLEEQRRKQESEEALFEAGGISIEAIRDSRFALRSAEVQISLMEKELEIRRIGLRKKDVLAAGMELPGDEEGIRRVLIDLSTAGLRAEAKAAAANLEAASRDLESNRFLESELIIRCPRAGTVGARYAEEGERLKREDKILTLMDTESLYAVFPVSETDALKLRKGMAARVSLDGTGESYDGKVDLVSPQADNQSFTFMVRVLLSPGFKDSLKPGMFARIIIPLENPREAVVIPESALARKKDKQGTVFVIRGSVLSERNVGLGRALGEEREIVSGLEAGEVVVLRPDAALRDGTYVAASN